MKFVEQLTKKIKESYIITREEAYTLLEYPLEVLGCYANEIREHFCGNAFDFCTIVNGKSGKCSEDCTYCAQSSHYQTQVQVYDLLKTEEFLKDARHNANKGVSKYSIVTSGKRLSNQDVLGLCHTYKELNEKVSIKLCASHGLLNKEELKKLKEAGVRRYHNNLETSRSYFGSVCTTHTYDEKITTIKAAKEVGLEVCSGGILGLGESEKDRVDLALELRALQVDSIPLNLLNPILGTPLEKVTPITEEEFLKAVAIFRMIHPTKYIRLAGGRNLLSEYGKKAFLYGANATITGDLLTTCGNNIEEDQKMVEELGYIR